MSMVQSLDEDDDANDNRNSEAKSSSDDKIYTRIIIYHSPWYGAHDYMLS